MLHRAPGKEYQTMIVTVIACLISMFVGVVAGLAVPRDPGR